ncbi:hypothetical protein [uncultured Victivallis sp.]|uniref:hypothetical protein n=1 Tax=uncultured Victivallis sp. TaxID=354118 RepID=UPI002587E5D2|nr:hypothetical protein [uncultured Victivallis sp.]
MKHTIAFLLFTLLYGTVLSGGDKIADPYGVCAHLSRSEHPEIVAPPEFARMRKAGIRQVRTDFDWEFIETSPGVWNFDRLDRLVTAARENDIRLLPILDYDVKWASPAWKNLDAWGEYVRRTVSRYSKDIRCWEIWNEQNIGSFWRDEPNAVHYVQLLKRAYEEIKKIDPELTVLYGGCAGVPLDFIEESLKAGAGKYFDAMNIHPYNWQGVPEEMIPEYEKLQALLRSHELNKPIWVTEVGWSTAEPPMLYRTVLPAAFRKVGLDPSQITLAVVRDEELGFRGMTDQNLKRAFPMFRSTRAIPFAELKKIRPKQYPVLIPAPGEEFPAKYLPTLRDYLKAGGTLLLPAGLPFYYDVQMDGKGGIRKETVGDKYLPEFHIGWEAWWSRKGIPEQEAYQKTGPEFSGEFQVNFKPAGRFLHARNLEPGDKFIPIIEAGTEQYKASVAALYQLNSDLKGNIIVCTVMSAAETVSEQIQAEFLARTYLVTLAHGMESVFWYNFRAGEWKPDEREAHFGIIRQNMEPKPSFSAYQTLNRFCPPGSTRPVLQSSGNFCFATWVRPDNVRMWAIWTPYRAEKAELKITGNISHVWDLFGKTLSPTEPIREITPAVIYLAGPENITL